MFRFARLAFWCAAVISSAAHAQTNEANWFEVEVLVFERGAMQPLKEQFNDKVALPKISNALDLITPLYSRDLTSVLGAVRDCQTTAPSLASLDDMALSFANPPELPFVPTDAQQAELVQAPMTGLDQELLSQVQTGSDSPSLDNTHPMDTNGIVANDLPVVDVSPWLALQARDTFRQVANTAALLNNVAPPGQYPLLKDCTIAPKPAPYAIGPDLVKELSPAPNALPATPITDDKHSPVTYLASHNAIQLKDLAWQLNNRSGHKVLLHTVFRSPLVPKRQSSPWRLIGGQRFSPQWDSLGMVQRETEAHQDDLTGAIQSTYEFVKAGGDLTQLNRQAPKVDNVWQLDGSLLAYNDRILSADVQLLLRQQHQVGQPLSLYRFNQSTRLLLGELHYLDHPKFGVVLQIRRFTPPLTPTL